MLIVEQFHCDTRYCLVLKPSTSPFPSNYLELLLERGIDMHEIVWMKKRTETVLSEFLG
jgi:hypothetical protein